MVTAEVVTVTPELAREWLEKNDHNRALRSQTVDRLAGAIQRGEWQLNGESIKINGETLIDGQHRLAAIVKAGIPVPTLVVKGLPTVVQETVDTGARRSLSDILKLRGEQQTSILASALFFLHQWETQRRIGSTAGHRYPTHQQSLALLDRTPQVRESVRVGDRVRRRLPYPGGLAAALHIVFGELNPEDADDFFGRLASGENLTAESPIFLLRRMLESERSSGKPFNRMRAAALTIKAWNAYRSGVSPERLRWVPGGAKPEAFPTPI